MYLMLNTTSFTSATIFEMSFCLVNISLMLSILLTSTSYAFLILSNR